jgi:Protein of unknown function (DUF3040)
MATVLEVEMLDGFERDSLREIERQIAAADPQLAAFLRGDQRRVAGSGTRTGLRTTIALLMLLVVALLTLGVTAGALAVAAVAGALWRLRGFRITHQ